MSVQSDTQRTAPAPADGGTGADSLVSLLGEQRAAVVEHLRCEGEATVAALADVLGVSEVATRKHLAVLEEEELVAARAVKQGRGRPATHYRLTDRARNLFPQRYASMASELMDFITSEHGREGLRAYLSWRLERETQNLAQAVTATELRQRLSQLAEALSEAGYDAEVTEDGEGFRLVQDHCAIYTVAKHHPEMCAAETATFSRVLGDDVHLSRRQTLAGGATACVCTVRPRGPDQRPPAADTPPDTTISSTPRSRPDTDLEEQP